MEAAVVSGILKVVGNKLAPLLIKEYSSIVGVQKHLLELKDQVQEINHWLELVGYKVMQNSPALNWLRKLKDIAYDVDDIVDEFQLKAEKHDAHGVCGVVSKYMRGKPKSLILQCEAAIKLKAVKKRFDAIVKQRTEFNAIANSLLAGHPAHDMNHTTANMTSSSSPTVGVASVLGRDQEKHKIICKLVETNDQQKIKTVSIIGLGGSGKTTVAKLVFNDISIIEKHFEVRLWVHVSQEFVVPKLVPKLFEAIVDMKSEQYTWRAMEKIISDNLTGKRYLLVLDDVWTEDKIEWDKFVEYLENGTPGSGILLTTRNRNVAEVVGSTDQFVLPSLSEDDSWQLFQKSLVMPTKGLEHEFVEVGKQIVKKCCGLPLAIKVLAGALHDKKRIEQWQAMRDNSLLDSEGEECRVSKCLWLSYLHLPSYLKPCFTICSLFPKGYMIDRERLIDQWIAHDMVAEKDGVDYLEYTGQEYFNSLVQMSFLQDVAQNSSVRVKCRMHDLVHDLARSILGDKISIVMPNEATSSTNGYRYFCLTEQIINLPPKNTFCKARAIYVDEGYREAKFGKALKKARHLRSITVECNYRAAFPTTILQIKNLKYLEISELLCEEIPESISAIWSLEALYLTCQNLVGLPESIGKLQKLRTLNLSHCTELKCLPDSIGDCQMISSIGLRKCENLTVLPNSIGKLQKLRTLNLSHCEELEYLPDSIGDCQMISSIDLYNCKNFTVLPNSIGTNEKLSVLRLGSTKIKRLPSSITTLRNLKYLDLQMCLELVELPEGFGNLEKLEVLDLKDCGKLEGMPVGIGQLSRLQKLDLFVVGEDEKRARISELANIGRNSEGLTIRGIARVMEPVDAHKACLKQKTNLQRLVLQWRRYAAGEVNTELVQAVLDGLEPPSGLKELTIDGYLGRQYARWMQDDQVGGGLLHGLPLAHFPFLRVMNLCDFPNLKHLDGLAELPCLEELELSEMPSLESINGGPFLSLMKLTISKMPSLVEVWMVAAERTMPDREEEGGCSNRTPYHLGQVFRVGNCLRDLYIYDCPKLKVKLYLPLSLQCLRLTGCSEQLLQSPGQCEGSSSSCSFNHRKKIGLTEMSGSGTRLFLELLQHMTALESLEIMFFYDVLTEMPKSLGRLTSLQTLEVSGCSAIQTLPESLGELRSLQGLAIRHCESLSSLPQSMGRLTSLQVLEIQWCCALEQLPECLGDLCSLRVLQITCLEGLTCLPQSMCGLTSLEKLYIQDCLGVKSLPDGIKCLTALQDLWIIECPDLATRCEKGKGEDWHLISHIPTVMI